jgi:hypothetical protein
MLLKIVCTWLIFLTVWCFHWKHFHIWCLRPAELRQPSDHLSHKIHSHPTHIRPWSIHSVVHFQCSIRFLPTVVFGNWDLIRSLLCFQDFIPCHQTILSGLSYSHTLPPLKDPPSVGKMLDSLANFYGLLVWYVCACFIHF